MFGRYALPSYDLAGRATSVTASSEADGYPPEYLIATDSTGHLNLPSRPAKLDDTTGYFDLQFAAPITVRAVAVIYPNFDGELGGVYISAGGGAFIQSIPVPALPQTGDDWRFSPWIELSSAQTYDNWRLTISSANSQNVQVGRLLLLGQLRQMETDVRYGGTDEEERTLIEQATYFGVETVFDMYNVRRRFTGEFGFRDAETADLLALWRSARNRVQPWLLIPDEDVNDAWFVRFDDVMYARTRQTIGFNTHPFRVREVSRGMPWP